MIVTNRNSNGSLAPVPHSRDGRGKGEVVPPPGDSRFPPAADFRRPPPQIFQSVAGLGVAGQSRRHCLRRESEIVFPSARHQIFTCVARECFTTLCRVSLNSGGTLRRKARDRLAERKSPDCSNCKAMSAASRARFPPTAHQVAQFVVRRVNEPDDVAQRVNRLHRDAAHLRGVRCWTGVCSIICASSEMLPRLAPTSSCKSRAMRSRRRSSARSRLMRTE